MLMKSRDRLCNSKSVDIVKYHFWGKLISGFPFKVHEVDSSRIITVLNERRNHEKRKFVLQDALIIRESLEQPDLQGL
ncbi:hypothetical protein AB9M92_02315 [Peribacillus frigoritolerans]|uniref:hypothetical protein n=1 Tax=Peribacillus frigoritolerans TaxID=450367 RepID=UPI0035163F67